LAFISPAVRTHLQSDSCLKSQAQYNVERSAQFNDGLCGGFAPHESLSILISHNTSGESQAAADIVYVITSSSRGVSSWFWLDVHKDPDVFSRETILSLSNDSVSRLWNHVTTQFRAWERAPQPPKHSQGMLPAEFSKEQYAKAWRRVRSYNRSIARAIQTEDEKALVSAIQALEG
jgi:hypothetical protein